MFAGKDSDQLLLALACAGFALALLALALAAWREALRMRRWPIAKGRVLSSAVEEYRTSVASASFGGPRSRLTLYRPAIVYEYHVAAQRFEGKRIAQSPGMDRGVADFAGKIARRYPEGGLVDVRYDPTRPQDSVLEPRVPRSGWLVIAIAVGLLGLAWHLYASA